MLPGGSAWGGGRFHRVKEKDTHGNNIDKRYKLA